MAGGRGKSAVGRPVDNRIGILFLIDDFRGPEGGTEQHLLFLQRELPRDRFRLCFAVLTRIQRMEATAFPVRPVMLANDCRGAGGIATRVRVLASYLRAARIDVVHAFTRTSEVYGCLAVWLAGRGRVLGVRRNLGYWHTWRSRWAARAAGLLGARYAANCEAARAFATAVEWIPRRRISVVPNAIAASRLREGLAAVPSRESLGIRDGEPVVGIVASVRPVKDYATFLHAATRVLEKRPDTRFLAIGAEEVDYARQMRTLASALGVDGRLAWIGPVGNPYRLLPLMDVAVLSSRSEAFSNALLEYAAAGVATVATDVGAAREIVEDGETGFLVPPGSPEVMSERIVRLLSDAELRRKFADQSRRRVHARFSQEVALAEYEQIYSELAGKTKGRP